MRLIESRQELGLTQIQFSFLTGIGVNVYKNIESLKYYPNRDQKQEIADALNKDVEWLFPPELVPFHELRREVYLTGEQVKNIGWIKPLQLPDPNAEVGLKEIIAESLDKLTDREKLVLKYRFGLDGNGCHTFEEISKLLRLNITKERIRQIEAKALRKLRNPKIAKLLKEYI